MAGVPRSRGRRLARGGQPRAAERPPRERRQRRQRLRGRRRPWPGRLLDERRCTTHHDLQDELARRYPRATVVRDVLYVLDDRVAPGRIASGIDLALHLVAIVTARPTRRRSPARWSSTRAAPATSSKPAPCCGTATTSVTPRTVLRILIETRLAVPLPLTEIASACGVSERTLTRRFTAATGLTPLHYQQVLRLERAEHLIGHGATVEAAARAVGFADARMLRRLRARAGLCPQRRQAAEPALRSQSSCRHADQAGVTPGTAPVSGRGRGPGGGRGWRRRRTRRASRLACAVRGG